MSRINDFFAKSLCFAERPVVLAVKDVSFTATEVVKSVPNVLVTLMEG
jgi:hypothetical protein